MPLIDLRLKNPKILIIKLSSMGDVLFALSIVSQIDRAYPTAQLDWVIDKSFEGIAKLNPRLNRIFPLPFKALKRNLSWNLVLELFREFKAIRAIQYDVLIDLQGTSKSGLISFLSKSHEKWSDRKEELSDKNFFWTYTNRFARKNASDVCRSYCLAVKQALGFYEESPISIELIIDKVDKFICTGSGGRHLVSTDLREILKCLELGRKYAIFFPYASKSNKWISLEDSIAILNLLISRGYFILIPSGSEEERRHATLNLILSDRVSLLPVLSVPELAVLFKRVNFFCGADTGLTHLASALNLYTATLFNVTDSEFFGAHRWSLRGLSFRLNDLDWKKQLEFFLSSIFLESCPLPK